MKSKAFEVYDRMPVEDLDDYEYEAHILRTYELRPDAYSNLVGVTKKA